MEIDTFMQLAGPPIGAAMAVYGEAVLTRAEDAAAEATANVGRRILQAVWHRRNDDQRAALEEDVREATGEGARPDAESTVREDVRRTLRADAELLRELAALLPRQESQLHLEVSGERAAVNTGFNSGTINTGTINGNGNGDGR